MMKKIIYFGLLALLLTSCSEDYHTSDVGTSPLLVSGVCTGSPSTRSTTLGNGSMIGISRIAGGAYTAQNNYKYANTSGVWSAATSNKILLVGNNNATLCAYSPYSSSVNVSSVALASGLYSAASDFCYGYTTGVNATNMGTGVSFTLDHAYAKLTLHFTKGASFIGTGNVKKITVTGGARSATLNLSGSSPSLTVTDATTPVTIGDGTATIFNTVSSSPYDVDVLMVPSSLSSGLTFTLNVDGTDKTATLSSSLLSALAAKTNYTIPISINTTSMLDLGGASGTNYVSITDWTVPSSVTNPFNDTGITNIQPESNSYIVSPGSTIYIPVSRATAGNSANFPSGAPFTTGLLWSDVNATHVTATATGRYIQVIASTTEGNSVVYAKNSSNQIVWSWHIWVTSYVPNTTTVNYNGKVWMDRNLGARSNGTGTTAYGLYYQWGRKDPFPGGTNGSTTWPATYGSSPATASSSTTPVSLVTSIQNPNIFYKGSSGYYDWLTPQDNTLWNNSGRTIYDPCPDGWRVPLNSEFSGKFPNNTLSGFWGDSGYFNGSGGFGYWWSGVINGIYAFSLNSDGDVPSYRCASGFSVRCVKN